MNHKKSRSFHVHHAILQLTGVLLVAAILISACSTSTPTPAPTPTSVPPTQAPTQIVIDVNKLYANPWILVGYGDPANLTVVQGGTDLTLTFTSDGTLGGFSGCNSFSGSFEAATDGSMSVGPLATTLMACPTGMDLETAYQSALQNARSFSFTSEGRLQIVYSPEGSAEQVMLFIVGVKPLTGTNWVLVSSGDLNNPTPVDPGVVITAVFSEDGYISGLAGCNQYNVGYTLSGEELALGPIAITQMICPTGMDAEQSYLTALTTVQTATISGLKLTITYNAGKEVLNYIAASVPLEYSMWTLTLINDQPIPPDTNITATFTPGDTPGEGVINGSAGCNTYNAGYTLTENNISVQPPAVTRMYCEGTMDTEQAYLTALEASTSYEIFVNTLVLTGPSGNLTFTVNRTPLTGALWSLVALGDVAKPEAPVKGSNFAAQFILIPGSPSGILNGTTGCNEYTTAFAASTTEIKINLPVATQNKTCVPGLTDQEQIYFLALNNATTYQISGNTLTIPYDDGKQALVFEGTQLTSAERPPLSDLNGTTWYLWYINTTPILAGTTVYAQIAVNTDGASGTISGSAGCNTYVATFGNNMAVQTSLNATQQCKSPDGIMDQEKTYVTDLSRAYGYWQTGNQLIINTGLGVLTYQNTKPASSYDQTHLLVGSTWYLISYGNTYSTPGTQEPYTLFKSDGTLEGYTGCNNFTGSFSTQIQAIAVSNLKVSQQACTTGQLQAQQDSMLNILGSASSYQVNESVMQIISDKGVLNYSLTPLRRDEVELPTALFSYPSEAMVNTTVTFDAKDSHSQVPIVFYEWTFGDGSTGTGQVIQHVYADPGTYDVKLRVTDERGNVGAVTQKITITGAPPEATATPGPTAQPPEATATPEPTQPPAEVPPTAVVNGPGSGFIGEPIKFDGSGSTAGSNPIASYTWSFGDGTGVGPTPDQSVTTLYNKAGSYQVSLVVTDQNGLSSSASMNIVISTRLDTPEVWILDKYDNQTLLPGTAITLQFLNGDIAGFAGCNSYTGRYTATQNEDGTYSVTISDLVLTKLACPEDIMDQEALYTVLLGSITKAAIQQNILTLDYPAGTSPKNQPYPEGKLEYHEAGTLVISPR